MRLFMVLLFFLKVLTLHAQYFEEKDGLVSVEAEHFFKQIKDEIRAWYITDGDSDLDLTDPDAIHSEKASGKKYIEILPDTRTNHDEKLIPGENFSNIAGEMAIVSYRIFINNPGKYYVWVRAYSTGTEDNGIHVGLDGQWPESGQRMQWCEGKDKWTWASKQRTEENHCGEEQLIFLEIAVKGEHIVSFSMREDGFEFDKFVLTKEYKMPENEGPAESEIRK